MLYAIGVFEDRTLRIQPSVIGKSTDHQRKRATDMPAARPTKAAVTRAVQAVADAGIVVGVIEIGPDGSIRITPKDERAKPKAKGPEQWD